MSFDHLKNSPALVFETLEDRLVLSAHPLADFQIEHFIEADLDFDVEPVFEVEQSLANAHDLVGLTAAREAYGFIGSGQTVAVIDSGIAYDHLALGGGFGADYRVVGGWDFTGENDANPYDDGPAGSHGTHVAGIIGSSDGVHTGVAPGVDLVALRVFDDAGAGYFSWVEDALQWVHTNRDAFDNPITAVNLSLGAEWNSDSSLPGWAMLEDEFAQLEQDGIFIVGAAGNSFTSYNTTGLSYPAVSEYVVPVASVDDNGSMSYFSQRHDRVIAAPGRTIVSTVPDYVGDFNGQTDDFANYSGTSMASPYVAGSSVLVREAMEFTGYQNITQDIIYDHMRDTADLVWDSATGQSYHRLNLGAALDDIMADDYGSSLASAYGMGVLADADPQAMVGMIGSLDDVDYFNFTAGATGSVSLTMSSADGSVGWDASDLSAYTMDGDLLSFAVVSGESYTVGLSSMGELAHYDLSLELTAAAIDPIDWGTVNFEQFADENISGETWYSFQATRDGTLTVEALFAQVGGDVDLEIYDANGNLLASSATANSDERVDVTAAADETFLLKVSGANSDVDFRLTNLVSQTGASVTVAGTAGNDTFTFAAGETHQLNINGVAYQFSTGDVSNFSFDGGDGSDTATLTGTAGDERAVLRVGSGSLTGDDYRVDINRVETVTVHAGGGNDTALLYDSAGDDQFYATPTYGTMSGSGFYNRVDGFDRIDAYATAGGADDQAYLYDSAGNDYFFGTTQYGLIGGDGFYNVARGFDRVNAYATAGGSDRAYLYDSAGDDQFYGRPDSSWMIGTGFRNQADGFDRVDGYATAGGNDRAYLFDSAGNDRFYSNSSASRLQGNGYFNSTYMFEEVYASASAGGYDLAYLFDSAGDDQLHAYADSSWFTGTGFRNQADGFDRVNVYSTGGGNDRAYFFDSAGNDAFHSNLYASRLVGSGFYNSTHGFGDVYAYATAGGYDQAFIYDTVGDDQFYGHADASWTVGNGFYSRAEGFERVHAYSTAGGSDRAYLFDTVGDDNFYSNASASRLQGTGYFNSTYWFEEVYAYATKGGNDRAYLYDSVGDDQFHGHTNSSWMSGTGYHNQVNGFGEVVAFSTAGGNDEAIFHDVQEEDAFYGSYSLARWTNAGGMQRAYGFDLVSAHAASGQSPEAEIRTIDYIFQQFGVWD